MSLILTLIGNPVKIWNSPRCCKPHKNFWIHLPLLLREGRQKGGKSEDLPVLFCCYLTASEG